MREISMGVSFIQVQLTTTPAGDIYIANLMPECYSGSPMAIAGCE